MLVFVWSFQITKTTPGYELSYTKLASAAEQQPQHDIVLALLAI